MIKKITSFILLVLFSCSSNNLSNSNKIVNKNNLETANENKNIFQYKENLEKLKKIFEENTKNSIGSIYFDDYNNGIIVFQNKLYILDKELNIVKIIEIGKYPWPNFLPFLVDSNGNGIALNYSNLATSFDKDILIKMENFIPGEFKIIDSDKYIPRINKASYNNFKGKGYFFLNDEKTLVLSDIDGFFNYTETKKFRLENKERFNSVILNKNNDGIVITKEEDEYHNLTFRYYNLKNNEIDFKQGKTINHVFEQGVEVRIYGALDENGMGFIYIDNYTKNRFEIKEIKNFEVKKEYFLFENMLALYKYLDSFGNGFIISRNNDEIYFNKIKNFNISDSNKLFKAKDNSINYSINSKGTGFISSSKIIYKNNDPINYNDYTIENKFLFVFDGNLIK
ncbi:MAG: hypothetical protein U0457_18960 [Candidatus Sericytochromatia bacterium]